MDVRIADIYFNRINSSSQEELNEAIAADEFGARTQMNDSGSISKKTISQKELTQR